jgi:hypothetical protein
MRNENTVFRNYVLLVLDHSNFDELRTNRQSAKNAKEEKEE